jgi:hypothetical protein
MKFRSILLTLALASPWLGAEPKPAATPKPLELPVIEVRASQESAPPATGPNKGTIELPAVRGQAMQGMSGEGRQFYFSPYGIPSGPGRAWPDAAPPGASQPAGGLYTPTYR